MKKNLDDFNPGVPDQEPKKKKEKRKRKQKPKEPIINLPNEGGANVVDKDLPDKKEDHASALEDQEKFKELLRKAYEEEEAQQTEAEKNYDESYEDELNREGRLLELRGKARELLHGLYEIQRQILEKNPNPKALEELTACYNESGKNIEAINDLSILKALIIEKTAVLDRLQKQYADYQQQAEAGKTAEPVAEGDRGRAPKMPESSRESIFMEVWKELDTFLPGRVAKKSAIAGGKIAQFGWDVGTMSFRSLAKTFWRALKLQTKIFWNFGKGILEKISDGEIKEKMPSFTEAYKEIATEEKEKRGA